MENLKFSEFCFSFWCNFGLGINKACVVWARKAVAWAATACAPSPAITWMGRGAHRVALAHVDKDEVRSTYNRADYIERRRPMMDRWSEYIHKAATGSLLASAYGQVRDKNVVPIL